MIRKLLQRLTDTSDGGKHLPWITHRVMAWLSGFDTDKYGHRQFIVANPKARVNPLLKAYYLLWIKRVDSKHNCSFGTSFNKGMRAIAPPICLMVLMALSLAVMQKWAEVVLYIIKLQ